MFVLIWATLLLSARDTGASQMKWHCHNGFCISLTEGEITAEAGLCVVIPCSFSVNSKFTVQHIVWFKCEPSKRKCVDSDVIFHTNEESKKVQPVFKGRVSLLEPELWRRNCSIVVNDLTESDSGSYQLRVNGQNNGKADGYTFSPKATVSVKGLTQKPTVVIPPLTEGQQATLTCTAPGLCSGSAPEITWTWRGREEKDSNITGNMTVFETVAERHISTLTFNSSAEHHGSSVTCKVTFKNNITTEETVTLNVTYVKEVVITGSTNVKEGESLNLTCRVDSFPPAFISWTTTVSDKSINNATETGLQNDTLTDPQNDTESYQQEESGMATFFISNMTVGHSGQYICTAKYLNETLMGKVDVGVIYIREPVITGSTTVQEGRALNLTCSAESFPPARITWTRLGSNTDRRYDLISDLQSSNASATLVIHNVTADHTGQYMCRAQHMDTTLTALADVTVTWLSKTLNSSGCEVQSDVLTCGCVSQGVPLPTITWPLLRSYPEYSITTTVSNHTVNSTITLTVKNHSSTAVECVSSNEVGEVKANITLQTITKEPQGQLGKVSKTVSWLEIIVAFLIGVLLSAVLCCLVTKCHRKKEKKLDETLEMVDNQEDPLIDANHAAQDNHTYYQETADEAGAVTEEKAALDLNNGPKDVEYASIDFAALKRKSARDAAKTRESTETEYAEIKREVKVEREDDDGEEGEVSEGKKEEVTEEDGETNLCIPEEEDEDSAVYSNVKDLMTQN